MQEYLLTRGDIVGVLTSTSSCFIINRNESNDQKNWLLCLCLINQDFTQCSREIVTLGPTLRSFPVLMVPAARRSIQLTGSADGSRKKSSSGCRKITNTLELGTSIQVQLQNFKVDASILNEN